MRQTVNSVSFVAGVWLAVSGVTMYVSQSRWILYSTVVSEPPDWLRVVSFVAWLFGLPLMPFMHMQAATGPDPFGDAFTGLLGGPPSGDLPQRAIAAGLAINSFLCAIVIVVIRNAWLRTRDELEARGVSRRRAFLIFLDKSLYNTGRVYGDVGYLPRYEKMAVRREARQARLAARPRRKKVVEDGCVPVGIAAAILVCGIAFVAVMIWWFGAAP